MISVRAISSFPVYSWIVLQILMIDDLHMQRQSSSQCAQYQQCSCVTTGFDRCLKDGNVTPCKPPVNPSIIQPRWKCYIPEFFLSALNSQGHWNALGCNGLKLGFRACFVLNKAFFLCFFFSCLKGVSCYIFFCGLLVQTFFFSHCDFEQLAHQLTASV